MKALSTQYERVHRQYRGEQLMLLSDIDGTILDMRHMVLAVLHAYDHETDTVTLKDCSSRTSRYMRTRWSSFLKP